jgi:transposase InsO family protein
MRQGSLLCQLRRGFKATTDSKHSLKRHPNFLNDMELYAPDQAWVADISYVRLPTTFFRQRTPDGRGVSRGERALS